MIATRTPLRVSLGGGGTDLPAFYRHHGGFVFSMAIDKYMYVVLNPRPIDRKVRLLYTKSEVADTVHELQHELAREGLKRHKLYTAIEVASLADVPAGTGMGSSSSYLVGLLAAIRAYVHSPCTKQELADEACDIELNILKKPIGKQDQFLASYGGLSALHINRKGDVKVERVHMGAEDLIRFLSNVHLYYTGHHRDALDILADQSANLSKKSSSSHRQVTDSLKKILALGYKSFDSITRGNFDDYGRQLHDHWIHKKRMSSKISLPWIDEIYETVRKRFGVLGGKLVGAGGGGFLLLYAPKKRRELSAFMEASGLPRLWYGVDFDGAKVISDVSSQIHVEVDHKMPGKAVHSRKR